MRPKKLDKLLVNLETQPSETLDRRIAAMITQAAQQGSGPVSPEWVLWRYVMQSKTVKLAAMIAIALISVMVFQVFSRTESVTWADVVQPILTARTVVFHVRSVGGENLPITRIMSMGTQRVRSEIEILSADGKTVKVIAICDFDTSQMLTLNPKQKIAAIIDIKGLPEKPENFVEIMRNMITELQDDPNVLIESLGENEIDGRMAQGFRATDHEGNELMIWADSQTSMPIRMELKWRQTHSEFTDFEFDVVLDESLFGMDIPEGYSTMSKSILSLLPLNGGTEQDLVETLRIWAEEIRNGVFPKDFSPQAYMDDMPKVRKYIAQARKEGTDEGPWKFARGWFFCRLLKPENDWHYVGKDVKFGDANSPVCWYRPTDSKTYRVIFGDLSVKELNAEDLPD